MKTRIFTPFNLLLLIGVTAGYIYLMVSNINSLRTKSYIINNSELYKLDSIKMLSKLYKIGGGKSGNSYEFKDETYKTFVINGIADVSQELRGILESCDVVMTIYTDKEGYENYFNKNESSKIAVFELKIENQKYINIADINNEKRKTIFTGVFILTFLFLIFLVIHFYRVTRLVPLK